MILFSFNVISKKGLFIYYITISYVFFAVQSKSDCFLWQLNVVYEDTA